MKKTDAIAKYYQNPKSRFIESGIVCRGQGGGKKGITFFDDNVTAKNDHEAKKLIPVGDIFSSYTAYTSSTLFLDAGEFAVIPPMSYGEMEAKYFFRLDSKYHSSPYSEAFKAAFKHSIDIELDIIIQDNLGKPLSARLVFKGKDKNGALSSLNDFFECLSVPVKAEIQAHNLLDVHCGMLKNLDLFKVSLSERVRTCLNKVSKTPIKDEKDLQEPFLVFSSKKDGYPFKVMGVRIYEHFVSEEYPESPFDPKTKEEEQKGFRKVTLKEDVCRRVSHLKYPNGAYKGIIVKPTYPMFNDKAVDEEMKSILMATLPQWKTLDSSSVDITKIEEFKSDLDLVKYSADGRAYVEVCTNQGLTCALNGIYVEDEEGNLLELYLDPDGGNGSKKEESIDTSMRTFSSTREYLGFVGANNLWTTIGAFYSCLGAEDNLYEARKGYHSAVALFNPNPFPVEVAYLTYI